MAWIIKHFYHKGIKLVIRICTWYNTKKLFQKKKIEISSDPQFPKEKNQYTMSQGQLNTNYTESSNTVTCKQQAYNTEY